MLVKTGDAEILDVVQPEKVEDNNTRKDALETALDRAKNQIVNNTAKKAVDKDTKAES